MKTKVSYSDVKSALKAGFISPLNSSVLTPAASLVRSLVSFRNAGKPRSASTHIDKLIKDSNVLPFWRGECPKTAFKQNAYIDYAIKEAQAQS